MTFSMKTATPSFYSRAIIAASIFPGKHSFFKTCELYNGSPRAECFIRK